MRSLAFLIGRRSAPTRSGDVPMMLFVSARGQRHRSRFEHTSVHFGEDLW